MEEEEDPTIQLEREFPNWTIQDHTKEIGLLKVEFQALAKKSYENKLSEVDDKVRRINAGTDKGFKRRLVEVEREHKRSQAIIDVRKAAQMACYERFCDGELSAAEQTFAEDKEWCKILLIRRLTRPSPETAVPGLFGNPAAVDDEFYMEPYQSVPVPEEPAEHDDGGHEHVPAPPQYAAVDDETMAASAGMHAMMAAAEPPPRIVSPAPPVATPTRPKKRSASTTWKNHRADPVVYMLPQHEIDDDLATMAPILAQHYAEQAHGYM